MDSTGLPKVPGIYKIFFLDPELFYIGSSIDVRTRCREHLKHLRKGIHHNIHLQRAYAIHGVDALHFEMVEPIERKEDLIGREQYYLDTLHPYYNIHPEARSPLGMKRSPETRAKQSALRKGKPPGNKGKHPSDETRDRLSASHMGLLSPLKGIPKPPEQQERLRTLTIGVPSWNKGKPWPEETQQRLRTARLGISPPNKGKKVERTPEQKAEALAKWRAARAANKAKK